MRFFASILKAASALALASASAAASAAAPPRAAPAPQLPRHASLGAAVADAAGGVKVTAIVPGSPAERWGIMVGDIATSVDGVGTANSAEFLKAVKTRSTGK